MVHGHPPGPGLFEQFLLGYHLAGMAQQQRQHLQRLVLDFHCQPGHPQLVAGFVEFDETEAPAVQRIVAGFPHAPIVDGTRGRAQCPMGARLKVS